MKIDPSVTADVPTAHAVRVQRIAMSAAKAEGEAAVQLIEQAGEARQPPPIGPDGQGRHVNTYG